MYVATRQAKVSRRDFKSIKREQTQGTPYPNDTDLVPNWVQLGPSHVYDDLLSSQDSSWGERLKTSSKEWKSQLRGDKTQPKAYIAHPSQRPPWNNPNKDKQDNL